jgi:hypothetical protein
LDDRRSKPFGLAQGVGDALGAGRVLEVAGVADEYPAGARRLAEEQIVDHDGSADDVDKRHQVHTHGLPSRTIQRSTLTFHV